MKKSELKAVIEAVLMVSDDFVSVDQFAKITGNKPNIIEKELEEMVTLYSQDEHGIEIRSNESGYKFYTKQKFSEVLSKHLGVSNEITLSPQAIETLSVIAYKQPISKLEVQDIRGVNSDGVIKTLELRGLIHKSYENLETGAGMYEVTPYTYELLGISGKDELAPISPFVPGSLNELGFSNEFDDIRKKPKTSKK